MKTLEELRKEINFIDDQILKLFEQRMNVVKDIYFIKQELNLPTFVSAREQSMKETYVKKLSNPTYENYYLQILEKYLEVSKQFQNALKENE